MKSLSLMANDVFTYTIIRNSQKCWTFLSWRRIHRRHNAYSTHVVCGRLYLSPDNTLRTWSITNQTYFLQGEAVWKKKPKKSSILLRYPFLPIGRRPILKIQTVWLEVNIVTVFAWREKNHRCSSMRHRKHTCSFFFFLRPLAKWLY